MRQLEGITLIISVKKRFENDVSVGRQMTTATMMATERGGFGCRVRMLVFRGDERLFLSTSLTAHTRNQVDLPAVDPEWHNQLIRQSRKKMNEYLHERLNRSL